MSTGASSTPTAEARLEKAARTVERTRTRARVGLLAPALVLIGVFGIVPLTIILTYSFLEPGAYGGVKWEFSPEAYVQFLKDLSSLTSSYDQVIEDARQVGIEHIVVTGTSVEGSKSAAILLRL